MITNVMPLYDELQYILEETLKTEITSSKDAADLLTTKINTINFVYTTLVLSGILLAIIISIFITRSLRKPLLRLVSATKDVADGKFKIQTEISSNDEISRLNESFNEMVVKLKQSQTELLSAKEDAEQSSQAKSLFLRSMSHELRTPMNAVLGYSQILSMEPLTEEQHRYITEITRSGNHLLELINQVLDLARIESDNLSIDLKTVKLSDIVNHCLPLLINNAMESNNIQLINNIENDTHNVIADPLNLRQVFINLISNAIKYNKKNGTITLNVEEIDNQKIRILITDTGIGLSPDEINKIFEPFQRLSFVNSAVEGTGIGLTITRQLIEKMNGEMGVDSVKDAGSTFWFSLPLSQQQPSSDSIITDFPKQSSQKHANTDNQYKILYIEDNPANYQLMQSIINRHNNMSLIHAASAEEGLELTTSILPDLILMDISLPGMNGIEAMHILKSNKKTSHVPVIAVTANALTDDVSSGLSSGFDEYITKPIDIPQLNAVLEQYLKPHLIYDNIT